MVFAQTAVSINAPIATVWDVMMDLDSYQEWNPFIERVDRRAAGPAKVGDKLVLHVRFRGGKLVASPERITLIDPPALDGAVTKARLEYEFYGFLHRTWMIRGRRAQWLEQDASGATRYRTEERFHGLMAKYTPVRSVQDGFERHAAALKKRAEASA